MLTPDISILGFNSSGIFNLFINHKTQIMQKFIVLTVLIVTVYQLDAQTRLITVEKGDTIIVGADMKIVIPAKQQLKKQVVVRKEYIEPKVINIQLPENQYYPQLPFEPYPVPVRYYQDQPVDPIYRNYRESNELPIVLGILAFVTAVGAVVLVYSERGRRKDDSISLPASTTNTFHVEGGSVETHRSKEDKHFHFPSETDRDAAIAKQMVKQWQKEKPYGEEDEMLDH